MFNSKFTWKDFFKGFLIGLIAYFLFFSPTFSPLQQQKKQEIEWKLYNNTNVNVSIKYPGTWQVEEDLPTGNFVAFIGPKKSGALVSFSMVYIMPAAEVDMKHLRESLKEDLKNMKKKEKTFRLINKEETIINKKEALKHISEFNEGEITVRLVTMSIICNNKSVLGSAGSSSSEVSKEYKPIFDHMINSIRC